MTITSFWDTIPEICLTWLPIKRPPSNQQDGGLNFFAALPHAGAQAGLSLTVQDKSGTPVSPGADGQSIVIKGLRHLGPGLRLIHSGDPSGLEQYVFIAI